MSALGEEVISLLASARHSVIIAAPFIRSSALSRLLEATASEVKVSIITRWRLSDLIAGASDLGVFDLAQSRGVPLYLRQDLHAKLYAGDDRCLVGSANVTGKALGWTDSPNLELLTCVDRGCEEIVAFESKLLTGTACATEQLRDHLRFLIDKLSGETLAAEIRNKDATLQAHLPLSWIPKSRNPEDLFAVYTGNRDFSRSVLHIMQRELNDMGVVSGLDREAFRAWIAALIGQTPLVSQVLQRIDSKGEVTESSLHDLLSEIGVDTEKHDTGEVLETLERWLTCFLSEQYETARDSIKLIKAKPI